MDDITVSKQQSNMDNSYLITPQLLAKCNKMKVTLSRNVVREFRLSSGLPSAKSDKQPKSFEFKDIDVCNSIGMLPKVIIEPLDHSVYEAASIGSTNKRPANSIADKAKRAKMATTTNQTKAKRADSKKVAKPKQKTVKNSRPLFILPVALRKVK